MPEFPDPISSSLDAMLVRFGERVRQAGRRYGLRDGDLDEVMQDVRIRLWRALGSGERIASAPGSYVFRTATTAALDLLRRRRVGRETELPHSAGTSDVLVATTGADRDLERHELADRIAQAVDALSESRRPVVRMWLAGFDVGEIRHAFGFSEPKARNLLSRGLADLRENLTRMGVGPGEP
jgi:RNA polymerase sigma factor (sigma-70 family)